jgi:carotenoid cleavage dioxygenase-like enzyme
LIFVEYHTLREQQFCSGVQFVVKENGIDEDDGWLVTYVHDERTNISQVVKLKHATIYHYFHIFINLSASFSFVGLYY